MRPTVDIAGLRFGRLVAIRRVASVKRNTMWAAQCDCGNITTVTATRIKSGHTRSCGCLKRETASRLNRIHGESSAKYGGEHPSLFARWAHMKERVTNPNCQMYYRYGGRGITLCAEWRDYLVFREWALANGYEKCLTIDRIDNDRGYSPENCRWVDRATQNRNKSDNVMITVDGITACLTDHTTRLGLSYSTIKNRLASGKWTPEAALKTPIRKKFRNKEICCA